MRNFTENIFPFFIAAFFILFIASCNKDKNKITVNGHVYEPYAYSYVSGANVTISSSKLSSGFYNSNYTDIATTTTDANGAFSFEFEQEQSSGYRFYIYKENYFDCTIDVPDADMQPENTYSPTLEIHAIGWIRLHAQNVNPHDSTDFIAYSYDTENTSCPDCCTNTTFKGYGKTYDTIVKCKTYGSNNVHLNWHVTRYGIDAAYSDTIFCPPFDTAFYDILY
jgi:hypothetical protein